MKKMSKFAVAGLLVLGLASGAQAADIKATGKWQIDSSWSSSLDYNSGAGASGKDNNFRIEQRVRTAFEFIANENLKGVLDTQIGSNAWGNGQYSIAAGRTPNQANGGSNSAGNGNIMLRKAYIDFKWPGTKVNILAGFQTVNLPSAFGGGSAILDDQVAALVVSAPVTDFMKVTAGYARPYDGNTAGSTASFQGDTGSNVYFAALPFSFAGNTNVTPFGVFADAGFQSVNTANAVTAPTNDASVNSPRGSTTQGLKGWWGGLAFSTQLLEPFKIMADFNYGSVDYTDGKGGRAGWLADFAVDYTGLSMMTPQFFFAYSSGDKDSGHDKGGRMPTLGNPQTWTVGSVFFGDADLISRAATAANTGSYNGAVRNVMGFWTAGIALKDIKLIDKLSHRVNLLYVKGTNDENALRGVRSTYASYGSYLTERDSLWEVDVNTKYQLYPELTLGLNMGYVWADLHPYYGQTYQVINKDNAYRVTAFMSYSF